MICNAATGIADGHRATGGRIHAHVDLNQTEVVFGVQHHLLGRPNNDRVAIETDECDARFCWPKRS